MTRLALYTAVVLAVLTGVFVVWQLSGAVVLFALSLALAAAMRPIIRWLHRGGLPNLLALLTTYLLVFNSLALLIFLGVGPLVTQVRQLGTDFDTAYKTVVDNWPQGDRFERAVAERLPRPEDLSVAMAGERGAELLNTVLGATFGAFGLLVDLVIVIFLSIYWAMDQVHFERLWLSTLPVARRTPTRELWRSIETEVGAYVRSEAVQSALAGVLLWLGYAALGQRYSVLLALIGSIAWLVPWVGVVLAAAAVALLSLPAMALRETAVWTPLVPALLYTSAVLLFLQLAVEPRFFDRRRYNALITAVLIFGLAEVLGFVGLLLGPPLATALQIVGHEWMRQRLNANVSPAFRSDRALGERMSELREALGRAKSPSPEVANMVRRLEGLIAEAEPVLAAPDQETGGPQPAGMAPAGTAASMVLPH
jgi:putative permease